MDLDPEGKEGSRSLKRQKMDASSDPNRWTQEEAEVCEKIRSTLKRKFQHLIEGVSGQGETRRLHDIYTELYITKGDGGGGVNDEHEVRQIERASWEGAAQWRPIKCRDIFKPLPDNKSEDGSDDDSEESLDTSYETFRIQQKPIRTVLTKGVAGIGKTVSVQKFILDWAGGQANQDIHFIFPLPFRELNLMRDKELSLVELLQHFFTEIKDPRILSSEYKVLFIFDGLDECRISLDFRCALRCDDVVERATVDVLVTSLIKGNLLPSALLWITTRPAAASQIPLEYVDQVSAIRGFSDPQKEEYFRKRISDENLANKTITHLKSSRSLYIMCHIPVFCWITATVAEKTSAESGKLEMPRTLTQMYMHFLIIQTSIKKEKYTEIKEKDDEIIYKLAKLAFQQLEKGNLIFYEEDLKECGINVTEASVYSGVCTQIFREETGLYQGKVFSFVHLSIQEFLAALYVFLYFSNREKNVPDQQQTSQLSALLRVSTLHELHKTAVDMALQSKNGHLDLFLRFLLGLSLESSQNLLIHLMPQGSHSQSPGLIVQYIKQKIRDKDGYEYDYESDRRINLFYCLNELNHHAVVEDTNRSTGTLAVVMLLPEHWLTRGFKFQISEEQLDDFDLQKYIKTPEKDLTELLSPDEVLQKLTPVVIRSTSAELCDCFLTEKSCAALASQGRSDPCSLKELNLSENELYDSGVHHLSHLLKNPHCKLEKLGLKGCRLTEKSCDALALAGSLKELQLSYNELHGPEIQHLTDLFKNTHSKLEKLELRYCSLTENSCAALASVGRSSSCSLKELDLSENELQDAGAQHLSELFKHPDCKLEKLVLFSCSLTEKSCAALLSAGMSKSCSLKELDLTDNKLQDAGVQHISDLLKSHHCKLEKLVLCDCSLTEKSCAALAAAGRSNSCSLKELNLGGNELHDAGVQHLSDLLKNPHCKLQHLELRGCSLTEKSCAALASAISSTPCSLKELNLSGNELHDAGVQHLSDLLKNPHCKLEKLELMECSLTEDDCAALASVLSLNSCSLKELNLSENELPYAGVHLFSVLFRNPYCNLEKLIVDHRILRKENPAAAAAASSSSSHSSHAAELQLTHKTQKDPGAQLPSVDTCMVEHHSPALQRSCEFCAEVPDSSHWVLVKPEVSTEKSISTYSLSSPAGSYECSESGLRWSCAVPVTLQYCFTVWDVLGDELNEKQMFPAGPLMDIKLMSGELEEISLPHFLCLGGCEASMCDAVRILHGRDSGVRVELCELTQHHARVLHPSFSLLGMVYSSFMNLFSPKVHCELLLFCTHFAPLVLHAYLVPNDPAHIRAIHKKEKEKETKVVWIDKPSAVGSVRMKDSFHVTTSGQSEIHPKEMNLLPLSTGNFCEVYMKEPEESFEMKIMSSQHTEPIWTAKIRREDYCKPSRSPGQSSSQRTMGASTECVSKMRPRLIDGVSTGVLKDIVVHLQAHTPPVLNNWDVEEVLHRSQVLQDQVSCLTDMVLKKGESACSIMLALLEELDPLLYSELHLTARRGHPCHPCGQCLSIGEVEHAHSNIA